MMDPFAFVVIREVDKLSFEIPHIPKEDMIKGTDKLTPGKG